MKKPLVFLYALILLATPALPAKWPSPAGAVNDFAHVIPAGQAQELEDFLDEFQQKTGNAIAVATFPSVEGADVDKAAVDLFQAWGIGQKGKDNGILILASIRDRRARIEVGYGLEDVVTDGDAGDILRGEVYPFFKQQQYGQGLSNAAHALAELILQRQKGRSPGPAEGENPVEVIKIILILAIIVFYLFVRIRFGGWWWGGGGYYGGGWGGGGFGGGGGGGFGGFGGGGSGGGGASGGW